MVNIMNSNTSDNYIPFNLYERAYLLFWNEQNTKFYLPNTVLVALYLIVGVIGNVTVILVYQFRLNKQKDGRYFVAPLAWIDFIALIVTASLNLTQNTKQIIFPGLGACKMLKYFSYSTTCASLYLLAAIAVQRYLKICRPFGRQMSLRWKRVSVFMCVIISLIVYTPVIFFYGVVEKRNPVFGNVTVYQCSILPNSPKKLKLLSIFQGFGFLGTICNVIIITVLYSIITISIVKQLRKMNTIKVKPVPSSGVAYNTSNSTCITKTNNSAHSVSNNSDVETSVDNIHKPNTGKTIQSPSNDKMKSAFRISFMFMTISVVGFLAYFPSWVLIVIETNNPSFWEQLSVEAFQVCLTLRRMYMINHLANPFIYGVFDKAFRQEMRKMFCKK